MSRKRPNPAATLPEQVRAGRVAADPAAGRPRDLARQAKVTASAEEGDARAANLIDGHVRDYPLKPSGKEVHQWAAKLGPDGAWIQLEWEQPVTVGELLITFDTGFDRILTLTSQDNHNHGVIRAPQPETVRDYTVSVRKSGAAEWTEVAAVKGNFYRLRRHKFDPVRADAVRLNIQAANGDGLARVFEVRCYA